MRTLLRYLIVGFSLLFVTPLLHAEVVNINKADSETLQRHLQGIGPVKSQAIVDYRKKHGPYKSLDDLLKVEGMGPKLLERNKNKLSLNRGVTKTSKADQSAPKKPAAKSIGSEKSTKSSGKEDKTKGSDVSKPLKTGEQKTTKDRPDTADSKKKSTKSRTIQEKSDKPKTSEKKKSSSSDRHTSSTGKTDK